MPFGPQRASGSILDPTGIRSRMEALPPYQGVPEGIPTPSQEAIMPNPGIDPVNLMGGFGGLAVKGGLLPALSALPGMVAAEVPAGATYDFMSDRMGRVPVIGQVLPMLASMAVGHMTAAPLDRMVRDFATEQLAPRLYDQFTMSIFGGESSMPNTFLRNLAKSEDMERFGYSPQDIWEKNRLFRGADNEWRYEIPDWNSRVLLPVVDTGSSSPFPQVSKGIAGPVEGFVGDVFSHPRLFEVFPELEDLRFRMEVGQNQRGASFNPATGITMYTDAPYYDPISFRENMLHELQHGVQHVDELPKGGNPQYEKSLIESNQEVLDRFEGVLRDMLRDDVDPYQIVDWSAAENLLKPDVSRELFNDYVREADRIREITPYSDPFKSYRALMGEAEARAVENRIDLMGDALKWTHPSQSFDIPFEEQIKRTY